MSDWFLEHPHADYYRHPDGRRWPRVSHVINEWFRARFNPRIPESVRRNAADIGTCVHAGIAMDLGHTVDISTLPQLNERQTERAVHAGWGWAAFREAHRPVPLHVELRLDDPIGQVVGTCDYIGHVDGIEKCVGVGVVDWKTSERLYLGSFMALAKYVDMTRARGIPAGWGMLVRLEKDAENAPPLFDVMTLTVDELAPYLGAFQACNYLHRFGAMIGEHDG